MYSSLSFFEWIRHVNPTVQHTCCMEHHQQTASGTLSQKRKECFLWSARKHHDQFQASLRLKRHHQLRKRKQKRKECFLWPARICSVFLNRKSSLSHHLLVKSSLSHHYLVIIFFLACLGIPKLH